MVWNSQPLAIGIVVFGVQEKEFVPWVALPSSIHGSKIIAISNPLHIFGEGRN